MKIHLIMSKCYIQIDYQLTCQQIQEYLLAILNLILKSNQKIETYQILKSKQSAILQNPNFVIIIKLIRFENFQSYILINSLNIYVNQQFSIIKQITIIFRLIEFKQYQSYQAQFFAQLENHIFNYTLNKYYQMNWQQRLHPFFTIYKDEIKYLFRNIMEKVLSEKKHKLIIII
ncbi:hypothetical protein pb186bvf_003004 [Paramecium bursaria]